LAEQLPKVLRHEHIHFEKSKAMDATTVADAWLWAWLLPVLWM
jgi:hypothetical protein